MPPPIDPSEYGDKIAARYDTLYSAEVRPAQLDFLAERAGSGPALELGIGTGRIALPLAARGIAVHGIDASPAMIEELGKKPGAESIEVIHGEFGEFALDERFPLVFVVFNTFFALCSQEEQLRCFECVNDHLTDDGVFVMETFVPDVARYDGGQCTRTTRIDGDEVTLEASQHSMATQRVRSRHLVFSSKGIEVIPVEIRYAWPSELDLMARLAGMQLRERWSNWKCAPFDGRSQCISVWQKASA